MRQHRRRLLLFVFLLAFLASGCAGSNMSDSLKSLGGQSGCNQGCQQSSPDAVPSARLETDASSNVMIDHFTRSQSLENIRVQVWEDRTFVASGEAQEIYVGVFENATPLKYREPILRLSLPDNSIQVYFFPPTDDSGQTNLHLPAVSAPTGTLIAYEVCVSGMLGDSKCVGENYLIWNY